LKGFFADIDAGGEKEGAKWKFARRSLLEADVAMLAFPARSRDFP
jgi:hypothetical protein